LALVGVLVSLGLVFGTEEVRILSPASLVEKVGKSALESKPALFGNPNYAVSITGRLVYPEKGNYDGCLPYDTTVETRLVSSTGNPLIFVIDRGNCFFAKKIRNAQDAGAKAVLVLNHEGGELPYMADDGTGLSLTTPSLIVSLRDGESIKSVLKDPEKRDYAGAVMQFGIPEADGKVEWRFWTSSMDETTLEFKNNFGSVAAKLGDDLIFSPHYRFFTPSDIGCDPSGTGVDSCARQCTNSNKYCAAVLPESKFTGVNVVEENLVQLCLWDYTYGGNQKNYSAFWDYLKKFQQQCIPEKFDRSCSNAVLGQVGVPPDVINKCISDSNGVGPTNGENSRIEKEIKLAVEYGVYTYPQMFVNDYRLRSTYSCPNPVDVTHCDVLSAICSGYGSLRPETCYNANGCPFGEVRDECGVCNGDGKFDKCGNCLSINSPLRIDDESQCKVARSRPSISYGAVVLIVLAFLAVACAGFFIMLRRSQANMRRELADIMASYAPLGGEEDHRGLMPRSTSDRTI